MAFLCFPTAYTHQETQSSNATTHVSRPHLQLNVLNPSTRRMRIAHSGFFAIPVIWVRRGRRSRRPTGSFLVEKNNVMKPAERTTCLYKNILHVVPAPLVGSLQAGAGLQAWSEEAVKAAPRIVKPRGRFRSHPITCAGALA